MREKSTQLGKEASATFNDIHSFCMQTMKNENEKKNGNEIHNEKSNI